ncbi:hypothetical protein BLOT_015378 [Blomia tropicalis]|nr:hypothetical protein BLOT_015378 [Blomia tropicalis]
MQEEVANFASHFILADSLISSVFVIFLFYKFIKINAAVVIFCRNIFLNKSISGRIKVLRLFLYSVFLIDLHKGIPRK